MKKCLAIVALLAAAGAAFGANPKVAVLDAVLPEKMDRNVAIGVTEKISEELVSSGRFMVLDRTTVAKSLEEIEFQMSGLVSDEDIRKAGDQLGSRLGAAFVVIARVSQVGDTYFITAKMIDVKTGEITAQASDESEGKIAITLKVAQNVGRKLAAGIKETPKEPAPVAATKKPAPAEQKPGFTAAAKPATQPGGPQSRLAVYYSQPFISGDMENNATDWVYGTFAEDAAFSSFGFAMQWLQFVWEGLYFSVFMTGMQENIAYSTFEDSVVEPMFDFQAGVGWGLALGSALQVTAGVHAGYAGYTAGSFWTDSGDSYGGWGFGVEAGLDWTAMRPLAVCVRVDWSTIMIGLVDEDYFNLQIGFGWIY
jgi:TolB-like protein